MSQKCACGGRGKCKETRNVRAGVRRRYECLQCKVRWNTLEVPASRGAGHSTRTARDAAVAEDLRAVAQHIDKLLVRFS